MSKFTPKRRKGGFTLIEIMIVVLIIGILLAIAIPNFMNARETSQAKGCITNLKQIECAKEQFAMENAGAPAMADLYGAGKYIKAEPLCPISQTDTYTVGDMATAPTCSVGGKHVLP